MKKTLTFMLYIMIQSITWPPAFAQINYSPVTIHLPNDLTLGQSKTLPNVKRIEQYEQNILMNVEEYNSKGNLIFDYYKQEVGDFWNGKYIVMIKGQLFNNQNQLIKSFNLHSNTYLSIKHYVYDDAGNNTEVWIQEVEDDTSKANSNPYRFIFTLTELKAVLEHPVLKKIADNSRKYLLWQKSFNENNNLIRQIEFTPEGTIASIETHKYGADNSLLYSNESSPGSGLSSSEIIYTYRYSPSRTKRKLYQDNNLLQITKISVSPRDSLKTISEIYFYTYDQGGNIISESQFSGGHLTVKSEFDYDEGKKLKTINTYLEGGFTPSILTSFNYNKEGHIILDERKDLRSGNLSVKKYSYKYQYHK